MADLVQLPFRIAAGLIKHYAKKVVGDDATALVVDALLDRGEEAGMARLDAWLAAPAAKKQLRRVVNDAEQCFAQSGADEAIQKRIVSIGLSGDDELARAIDRLPNEADDESLRAVLLRSVMRTAPDAPRDAAERAVDAYLRCLRRSLVTLKDKSPAIVAQAVLRMETTLDRVDDGVRRTEQKLDAFIAEARKRVATEVGAHIIDFADYIADKTRGFVGRAFVFTAIDQFLEEAESGYFVIRGDPGIGKSAVLARLVADRGYAHHFNIAAEGIVSHQQLYTSGSAQVIARFGLDHAALPARAGDDATFLKQVLTEAVDASAGAKVVLVIDALDEAESPSDRRTNPLRLPKSVPRGAYIITSTRRRREGLELDVESHRVLELEADSDGNLRDIEVYIAEFAGRPAMPQRIAELGVTPAVFASRLRVLSEGNFMYLRHVLPAIEAGAFRQGSVDELPRGLVEYYRRHWEQMRGESLDAFARNKKVIAVLATARQPTSPSFVARVTGLSLDEVQWTLDHWREFLHKVAGPAEARYRIYHASYRDFLAQQVAG